MKKILNKIKEAIRVWALKHAEGPHAKFWLAFFSFFEASLFPIPPDAIMVGILLSNKGRKWIYYAGLTTIFSVLGGIFAYLIGFFAFEAVGSDIIAFYDLGEVFQKIGLAYEGSAFWVIFAAAITPIPYKVFVLSAGVFKISIVTVIVASLLGRMLRFFGIAYFIRKYGVYISDVLYKYFNALAILTVVILLVAWFVFV